VERGLIACNTVLCFAAPKPKAAGENSSPVDFKVGHQKYCLGVEYDRSPTPQPGREVLRTSHFALPATLQVATNNRWLNHSFFCDRKKIPQLFVVIAWLVDRLPSAHLPFATRFVLILCWTSRCIARAGRCHGPINHHTYIGVQ